MGRPVLYSSEVPARCQALIQLLAAQVEKQSDPDGIWGGPLKTTFLLAMATPMLVLPLERIFKPAVWKKVGIANELTLDPRLDAKATKVFSARRPYKEAPFYRANTWSYVPNCPAFKVAEDWPADQLDALDQPEAFTAADQASAGQVLMTIRNALAHGGITYLDQDGRHTHTATNMLGFASLVGQHDSSRLRLLRVSVLGFETFLRLWAEWLSSSGTTRALDEQGPGYFNHAAE